MTLAGPRTQTLPSELGGMGSSTAPDGARARSKASREQPAAAAADEDEDDESSAVEEVGHAK